MQATEDREADFDAFVDKSGLPLMLRDARQAGLHAGARPRAAPAGRRPPAVPVARAAALRREAAGLHRGARRRASWTTPAIPPQTLDLYEDGDHLSRDGRRRYTEIFASPPAPALSVIFHSLDFVVFFVVVVAALLAAAAPRAERAAARRRATSSTATSIRGS